MLNEHAGMPGPAVNLDRPQDVRRVLDWLIDLAVDDVAEGISRPGAALLVMLPKGSETRPRHKRLLTTVYNQVQRGVWLLELERRHES